MQLFVPKANIWILNNFFLCELLVWVEHFLTSLTNYDGLPVSYNVPQMQSLQTSVHVTCLLFYRVIRRAIVRFVPKANIWILNFFFLCELLVWDEHFLTSLTNYDGLPIMFHKCNNYDWKIKNVLQRVNGYTSVTYVFVQIARITLAYFDFSWITIIRDRDVNLHVIFTLCHLPSPPYRAFVIWLF